MIDDREFHHVKRRLDLAEAEITKLRRAIQIMFKENLMEDEGSGYSLQSDRPNNSRRPRGRRY